MTGVLLALLLALVGAAAAWGQTADAARARPVFPPIVRVFTVTGGDFVHVDYVARGVWSADRQGP